MKDQKRDDAGSPEKEPAAQASEAASGSEAPAVIRSSRRHPETGKLCFSAEEWDEEDRKANNQRSTES